LIFERRYFDWFRITISAAGLYLGSACGPGSTSTDSMPELINVYGVLTPGDSLHQVIVERAVSIDEPNTPETAAVTDALVRISDGQRTVTLKPAEELYPDAAYRPGTYLIDAARFPLVGGQTYQLTVETATGDRIEGQTLIPGSFSLAEPGDTLRIEPTAVYQTSWTRSEGAWRYILYAYEYQPGQPFNPEESRVNEYSTRDTTGAVSLLFNRPGWYVLEIWAVDLNLFDYYRSRADRPELEIINHLSGGVGVFGSRVVRKKLVLVEG